MYFIRVFVVALWMSLTYQSWSQVNRAPTRQFSMYDLDRGSGYRTIDSSLQLSELYDRATQVFLYQNLGNFGTPVRSVFFRDDEREIGFQYAFHPLQMYYQLPSNVLYFNTKRPFTDLSYGQGKQGKVEMLYLNLTHAQNINPRLSVGLDFSRIASDGFQENLATSMYNVSAFTAFTTKNLRYVLLANTNWNRGQNQENGGISSDSAFEALSGNARRVDPKLTGARTLFRNRSVMVKQYYRWGKANYSYTDKDTFYSFQTRSQLSFEFHAEEDRFIFTNNGNTDSVLLPNRYIDTSNVTYDSAYFGRINNRIAYQKFNQYTVKSGSVFDFDTLNQRIHLEANLQLIKVGQMDFGVTDFNHILIAGYTLTDEKKQLSLIDASAQWVVAGYNAGDYQFKGSLATRSKHAVIGVKGRAQQFRPDFVFQRFYSNAFIWSHAFNPTRVQSVGFFISSRKLRHNITLQADVKSISDLVILNGNYTPTQIGNTVQLLQLRLDKTIQLWKFYLEHTLMFQQASNNDVTPVPQWFAFLRYTYRARFFGISTFHLGFDLFYNTAYEAMGYHPSLRMFHTGGGVRVGDYPILDPFLACEIKRASFYLKFEHINQDWFQSTGMYSTPHYPVSQQNLRIGLRWRFYD